MDTTLINILVGKVADTVASTLPAIVSTHPKTALTTFVAIWAWEHLLAKLPIQANSTGQLLWNIITTVAKQLYSKGIAK